MMENALGRAPSTREVQEAINSNFGQSIFEQLFGKDFTDQNVQSFFGVAMYQLIEELLDLASRRGGSSANKTSAPAAEPAEEPATEVDTGSGFAQKTVGILGLEMEAGQIIPITLSDFGLDDEEFLIDSVRVRVNERREGIFTVRALSGEQVGGWVEFFKKMAAAGRKFVIRENEVLILFRTWTDDNLWFVDELTVT